MILTHFVYDKITITYDEPVPCSRLRRDITEEVWKEAQIHFKYDPSNDLSTLEIHGERDRFILLGKARVLSLTPYSAKFEAYWWSSYPTRYNKDGKLSKRQKNGFKRLVRADIVCEF